MRAKALNGLFVSLGTSVSFLEPLAHRPGVQVSKPSTNYLPPMAGVDILGFAGDMPGVGETGKGPRPLDHRALLNR